VSNIRVHRKLAAEEGNIVVSPVSIAVALAMAAAGEHVLFLKKQSQNCAKAVGSGPDTPHRRQLPKFAPFGLL